MSEIKLRRLKKEYERLENEQVAQWAKLEKKKDKIAAEIDKLSAPNT